ncbi:hypothetical protein BDK51DRAFT_27840, partial [Blyttiomyces helicus]
TRRIDVLNAPLHAKNPITIHFYGVQRVAHLGIVEDCANQIVRPKIVGDHEVNQIDAQVASPQVFQPGSYEFPFSIRLPATLSVPFSYDDGQASASLAYIIEAKLRMGLFSSDIKSHPVPIHVIPPPHPPDPLSPGHAKSTNSFITGGSATATIQTQRDVFVSGCPIVVDVHAVNDSTKHMEVGRDGSDNREGGGDEREGFRGCQIQIELHQTATLKNTGSRPLLQTLNHISSFALTTLNFPGVGKLDPGLLRVQLPIPAYAPPTVSNTSSPPTLPRCTSRRT